MAKHVILDTASIKGKIRGIRTSTANQRENIHQALAAIVGHSLVYGGFELASALLNATNGMARGGMAAWLETHGPFVVDRADWSVVFSKAKRKNIAVPHGDREAAADYVDGLEEEARWHEMASGRAKGEAKEFDLMKLLEALIDRATKKDSKGECLTAGLIPYLTQAKASFVADVALAQAKAEEATKRAAEEAKFSDTIDVEAREVKPAKRNRKPAITQDKPALTEA